MECFKLATMRIISRIKIKSFWEKNPDSEQALKAWYNIAKKGILANTTRSEKHFWKC